MRKRRDESNPPIYAVLIPDLFGTQLVWSPGYARLFDSDPDRLVRWPDALLHHRSGREPTQARLAGLLRSQNLKAGRVIEQFGTEWYGGEIDGLAEDSGFTPAASRVLKAGYDWRRAPEFGARQVDERVRAWAPPGALLFILAHGYGGLVYHALRSRTDPPAWLGQVGFVAWLGTPHRGTPAALEWLRSGGGMSLMPPLTARTLAIDPRYPFAHVLRPAGTEQDSFHAADLTLKSVAHTEGAEPAPERSDVEVINVVGDQYRTPCLGLSDEVVMSTPQMGDGLVPLWSGLGSPARPLFVDEPHRALLRSQRLWNAIQSHCDLRGLSPPRQTSEQCIERQRSRRQLQVWLTLERENGVEGEQLSGSLLPVGMLSTGFVLMLTPLRANRRCPGGVENAWSRSIRLPTIKPDQDETTGRIDFRTPPLPRAPLAALRVLARHPVHGRLVLVDELLIAIHSERGGAAV